MLNMLANTTYIVSIYKYMKQMFNAEKINELYKIHDWSINGILQQFARLTYFGMPVAVDEIDEAYDVVHSCMCVISCILRGRLLSANIIRKIMLIDTEYTVIWNHFRHINLCDSRKELKVYEHVFPKLILLIKQDKFMLHQSLNPPYSINTKDNEYNSYFEHAIRDIDHVIENFQYKVFSSLSTLNFVLKSPACDIAAFYELKRDCLVKAARSIRRMVGVEYNGRGYINVY